jgi:hypothetical protein
MYEMLYGVTPYRGKSQDDTFSQILEGEIRFPDQHIYPVEYLFNYFLSCRFLRAAKG